MEDYLILIAIVVIIYGGYGVQEFLTPIIGPIYATMIAVFGVFDLFGLTWLLSGVFDL